jgi:transcriptional regulator with XRE-family HTH domain
LISGKQLKIKRIILDIEAKEIAKYIGVSKSYISLMEKGERRIPKDKMVKWCEFLGVIGTNEVNIK